MTIGPGVRAGFCWRSTTRRGECDGRRDSRMLAMRARQPRHESLLWFLWDPARRAGAVWAGHGRSSLPSPDTEEDSGHRTRTSRHRRRCRHRRLCRDPGARSRHLHPRFRCACGQRCPQALRRRCGRGSRGRDGSITRHDPGLLHLCGHGGGGPVHLDHRRTRVPRAQSTSGQGRRGSCPCSALGRPCPGQSPRCRSGGGASDLERGDADSSRRASHRPARPTDVGRRSGSAPVASRRYREARLGGGGTGGCGRCSPRRRPAPRLRPRTSRPTSASSAGT